MANKKSSSAKKTASKKPARKKKGYDASRSNATKHGILSDRGLLDWENQEEFQYLLDDLVAEHKPQGPTELHLVEQLAYIMVKRQRLRAAERSAHGTAMQSNLHKDGLSEEAICLLVGRAILSNSNLVASLDTIKPIEVLDMITSSHEENIKCAQQLIEETEGMKRAVKAIRENKSDEEALAELGPYMQHLWQVGIPEDWPVNELQGAIAEKLADLPRFILRAASEFARISQLYKLSPAVQRQARGESFDTEEMLKLGRYEAHLNKQFKDTLTQLYGLQEVRARKQAHPLKSSKLLGAAHSF